MSGQCSVSTATERRFGFDSTHVSTRSACSNAGSKSTQGGCVERGLQVRWILASLLIFGDDLNERGDLEHDNENERD